MLCIFENCTEPPASLCLCSSSSFLCHSHSKIHQSSCKSPQIDLPPSHSLPESLKSKLSSIKSSIKSSSKLLINSIESICNTFLSELNTLELYLQSAGDLPDLLPNTEALENLQSLIKDYLGISTFSFSQIVLKDSKKDQLSNSTTESLYVYQPKNPVGVPLGKSEGISWLIDNGLEFDEDQIYEITVNEDKTLAFLCEMHLDCES